MKDYQVELQYYPGEYEIIQVTRNGQYFDVELIVHDGDFDELSRESLLTRVDWATVQTTLTEYGMGT